VTGDPPRLPTVAIAIAVLDEAANIAALIDRLRAQDYPPDRFEIVFADGGSTDGTVELIRSAAASGRGPAIRLVDNPQRVPAGGFNRAIAGTSAALIAILGGHTLIPPDWLRRSVAALETSGADVAGGVITTVGRGKAGRAIAAAMSSPFGVGSASFRTGRRTAGWVDTVAFGVYRREVFQECGDFDVDLVGAEDDELNYRALRAGKRIWIEPTLAATYFCRSTYRGLWQQYYGYGRGKALVLRKHHSPPSVRMLVPPLFVAVLAGSCILAPIRRLRFVPLGIGGSYALAALTAGALTRRAADHPRPSTLATAAAFPVLHISYGLGLLREAGGRLGTTWPR
jgi:GT2 family glycosyltransferase